MLLLRLTTLLSLSSLAVAAAVPSITVDCKAPWVKVATNVLNTALPTSSGSRLCSSILKKYQTTTRTTTLTTGTITTTTYESLISTAPTPTVTTTTVLTKTEETTADVTVPYTTTTDVTETVASTSTSYVTTTITVAPSPPQRRDLEKRAGDPQSSLVSKCAQVIGIATSLVSGFCSCQAPGPTSTSTAVVTGYANATYTSTLTTYTATVTPNPSTVVVTSYVTVTSVVETVTHTSTTIETNVHTTTTIETTTVTTTATVTAVPSFYLQSNVNPSADNGAETRGQCAYYEPYQQNPIEWPGRSVAPKAPALWTIDPETGYLSSGGLIAGSTNGCDSFGCVIFPRGYTAAQYEQRYGNGQRIFFPLKCSFNGQDKGPVICTWDATSFGRTFHLSRAGLQPQDYGAGHPVTGQQALLYYDYDFDQGMALRAVFSLSDCLGRP